VTAAVVSGTDELLAAPDLRVAGPGRAVGALTAASSGFSVARLL